MTSKIREKLLFLILVFPGHRNKFTSTVITVGMDEHERNSNIQFDIDIICIEEQKRSY